MINAQRLMINGVKIEFVESIAWMIPLINPANPPRTGPNSALIRNQGIADNTIPGSWFFNTSKPVICPPPIPIKRLAGIMVKKRKIRSCHLLWIKAKGTSHQWIRQIKKSKQYKPNPTQPAMESGKLIFVGVSSNERITMIG